jgi:hypothetical protein
MLADIRSIVDLGMRRMVMKMGGNNSPDEAELHFRGVKQCNCPDPFTIRRSRYRSYIECRV